MRPLPAVLLDLLEERVTGQLVLKRGRVSKTIDLVEGNPVSASSTPRDETLGHFLVSTGVITEQQHQDAVAEASRTGAKLGEVLVAANVLTANELVEQLALQARHKLVQSLRWPQGAWRFTESATPGEGNHLDMVEIVLGGLRATAVDDLARLARLEPMTFELTPRGRALAAHLGSAFGARPTAMLAAPGGARMFDLERVFADRAHARYAIDAMLLCDIATPVSELVGLGTGNATRRGLNTSHLAPPPRQAAQRAATGADLFDMLFDDLELEAVGERPLEFPDAPSGEEFADEDSGVVSIEAIEHERQPVVDARKALHAEHQRLKGADHYAVLQVHRRAQSAEIERAYQECSQSLRGMTALLVEPRDRRKLDELATAYVAARTALVDDRRRTTYDRELAGGELVQVAPGIDIELAFRVAEDLIAKQLWSQAVGHVRTVIARAPNEADYHAALGWCEWMAAGQAPEAADRARDHLNTALSINPDHAAAHEYKGRIGAALHEDDAEALFHLERAVDLDPERPESMTVLEKLLLSRGELRRLERVLKKQLFRLRGRGTASEARGWARLAGLYFEHLEDPQAGASALTTARNIAADEPEVIAVEQRLATEGAPETKGRARARASPGLSVPRRTGWHEALSDPHSGAALVHSTAASGHGDAAFLAASSMIALGTADDAMTELYERSRVRGARLPNMVLGRDQWAMLRHKDDSVELGALMELLAPAVHALAPMTLADSELDATMELSEADLPPAFAKLRRRIAALLGVDAAPVFARVELGTQVHVIAADPPVLVAGDEALTAPDRPDLVFRLVRAMTFLWPGRAVGASRPGRVLKAAVMAMFREAAGSPNETTEPLAEAATRAVAALPGPLREQARAAALRLVSRGGGLNLSLWSRSLARTADRAGMLFCGDVPAALAGASEMGELDRDLQEFAFSAAHVQLRAQLGLSRP